MRKLTFTAWISLDGVVQSPVYPDEDTSGGFEHGGWHPGYFDDASMAWTVKPVLEAGAFLFGRGTYLQFAAHWPNASQEKQVLAEPLNSNTSPRPPSPVRLSGRTRRCWTPRSPTRWPS